MPKAPRADDDTKPRAPKRRSKARDAAKLGLLSSAALGMSAGEVMATIIDFGSIPIALNWGSNGSSSTFIDLTGDSNTDIAFGGSAGMMDGSVDLLQLGMMTTFNVLTNGSGAVAGLALGASIGTQPSSSFVAPMGGGLPFLDVDYNMMNMTYSTLGTFTLGSAQYFGFQFSYMSTLVNAWGLLELTGGGTTPFQLELSSGAFEDSGAAIAAGASALPEPGTGGLLALGLGAAGVTSMRRRRQELERANDSPAD